MVNASAPTTASTAAELANTVDWMDIFYNAEVLLGAENSGVEDFSGSNVTESSTGNHVQETVAVPPSTGSSSKPLLQPQVEQPSASPPNTALPVISAAEADSITISAEAKALARSERKRSREKQRRLDVNAQIVELTAVLQKVEGEEKNIGDISAANAASPGNRVDLIARTITALSRFHNENGKRQTEIFELQEKVNVAKKKSKEAKLKEQQELAATAQQQTAMMMPMMNGGFMQMQTMMFQQPTSCYSSAVPTVYSSMVQPKVLTDVTKPQSIIQGQPTFVPYPSTSPISYPQNQSSASLDNNNVVLGGNLAHCA